MNINDIELCASYWTVAGNTFPGDHSEISPFPLRDRAEACGKVGWKGMGFVLADMQATIRQIGIQDVRSIFADNGIRHVELEFLVDWQHTDARGIAAEAAFSEMLELCSQLDARKIKLGGGVLEEGEPDIPMMRDAFGRLCERAAPLGVDLVVEFLPFAQIDSIDRAIAMTRIEGISNGGLLVDNWHIERGGMTADDIRKIPRELLKAVELDDAGATMVDSLFNDSTHYRKLCGEGVIDIPAQIQAILDVGYDGYWGVEVISAEHRRLSLEDAARRAFETTMAQFETVSFPQTITA